MRIRSLEVEILDLAHRNEMLTDENRDLTHKCDEWRQQVLQPRQSMDEQPPLSFLEVRPEYMEGVLR